MRIVKLFTVALLGFVLYSCGNNVKKGTLDGGFAGQFTDEFGNEFVLNDDYTATIKFVGTDSLIQTSWSDGDNHELSYAMIAFNGDHAYYYLRDGSLYRDQKDMEEGRTAIKIKYD